MSPRQLHRRTAGARERGAVLIQVALAMTVLGGFCAMSIDYGLLMAARGQVQTAADAGALAGAIALGFDEDFDVGHVKEIASTVATANLVAQSPAHVTNGDVQPGNFVVPGFPPTPARNKTVLNGMTVSARRNGRGNALPTFFGHLVGIGNQGVQAKATAVIVPSNASDCVWPLAIPDLWLDNNTVAGSPAPAPTFVKYGVTGPPTLAIPPDTYTPPFTTGSGSGYALLPTLPVKFNLPLTLTNLMDLTKPAERGRFVPVQVPRGAGGGFASNLASCNNSVVPVTIGDDDRLQVEAAGTLATVLAVAAGRVAADPIATWNPTTFQVENSCAVAAAPCAPMSPRLVVLPVFDLNRYEDTRWPAGATPKIRVVNFVGFFIKQVTGTSIVGQITLAPGRVVMGRPMVGYRSAFLRTPFLSR